MERWDEVKRIFAEAVELPADRREAWLAEACADDPALLSQVRGLLRADGESDPWLDRDARAILDEEHPRRNIQPGEAIDAYRLVRKLGVGGMGEVWLAEQSAPVQRDVALKIVKRGMDSDRVVARFATERQALAMMDHPAIAKVFDAGTTEGGRPYFAMEYVPGVPINEYCDNERLVTRRRLDLFLRVCEGVQHAHQKGIIHRDLKPSNVLVSPLDGQAVPKIIDFGIAKATDSRSSGQTALTELGVLMGTPEYMSPEQADPGVLDVDTRSDVYSLGVLLYELLTGELPFDARELRLSGVDEAKRRIRDDDPPRPSTRYGALSPERTTEVALARRSEPAALRRQLKGDLDWIVMRALEKDRARRYGSPTELAADIRRHLAHEPVIAGPPGVAYRLRKFVRRHRVSVGFAAVLVAVLVGVAAMLGTQARRIARSARELQRVAEFQAAQLSEISPQVMGLRLRESILTERRRTLERAGREAAEVATAMAELETDLEEINFTDVARASLDESIFQPALATIDREFSDQPLVRARLLQSIATIMTGFRFLERAEAPQAEALRIRRQLLPDAHPDTLESTFAMADLANLLNRHDEGRVLIQEAATSAIRTLGPDDPLSLRLRFKTAQEMPEREALIERMRRDLGEAHAFTLESEFYLSGVFAYRGQFAEAERYARMALEAAQRGLGPDDPTTLDFRVGFGGLLLHLGRLEEAERLLRENLPRVRARYGNDHPRTLETLTTLATVLETGGQLDEAERLMKLAYETSRRALGSTNTETVVALHNLGFVNFKLGRLDEAVRLLSEALDLRRAAGLDYRDQGFAGNLGNLAMALATMGRGAEAEPLARQAIAGATAAHSADHWLVANSRGQLGLALMAQGRYAEAERELLAAHASLLASLGEDHERTRRVAGYLADLHTRWHDAAP